MRTSRYAAVAAAALLGLLALSTALVVQPQPADAKPKIASGSNCDSSWVNNQGAMSCFIEGEEDSHNGVKHPHYVACIGSDVFCCVDDDRGNQDCNNQPSGRLATKVDWSRALLSAQRAHVEGMKPGSVTTTTTATGVKATGTQTNKTGP